VSERVRLPDERRSVTKKLVIRCTREDPEKEAASLRDKLGRIRNLATGRGTPEVVLRVVKEVACEPGPPATTTDLVKVYAQVGFYPDGRPGEVFLKADRVGSTLSGMLDALSMCMSVALQAGVPLSWFVEKLRNLQFEPSGPTDDPMIRYATSIVDGLAKWLEYRVLTGGGELGPPTPG
jgi:hypothetical protein